MKFNKLEKISFVNQFAESLKSVISEGYDSNEAKVLEALLKGQYAYNKELSRKNLLSTFIKVYCELNNPGYIVVGGMQFNSTATDLDGRLILNSERVANKELTEKRIWEFINHK